MLIPYLFEDKYKSNISENKLKIKKNVPFTQKKPLNH